MWRDYKSKVIHNKQHSLCSALPANLHEIGAEKKLKVLKRSAKVSCKRGLLFHQRAHTVTRLKRCESSCYSRMLALRWKKKKKKKKKPSPDNVVPKSKHDKIFYLLFVTSVILTQQFTHHCFRHLLLGAQTCFYFKLQHRSANTYFFSWFSLKFHYKAIIIEIGH